MFLALIARNFRATPFQLISCGRERQHFSQSGDCWTSFPTHDGLTCIWAGRSHDEWDKYRKDVEGNYLDIIGLAPSLAERLKCSEQVTSFKGASKLLNFYRQSFGKGWALKVRAFFVVGATVVVHGRRGLSCYRLAHACSQARQLREPAGGGPRVSPSLYQEYGRGLLIVRFIGVAGRYDAPEFPLLPCRGWTRLINSRGRSRSWGRQFRLPLTGYHRNQRRTLGTLSPRSQ
jgi:hypothetical protein